MNFIKVRTRLTVLIVSFLPDSILFIRFVRYV